MRDVRAVKWLTLEQAIGTLTHAHERAFLADVAPAALKAATRSEGVQVRPTLLERIRAWLLRWRRGGA